MAPSQWHDINSPGFLTVSKKSQAPAQKSPEVEYEPVSPAAAKEPEVKLSDPQWAKGPDGFVFNKKCKVSVKVDYLKTTNRKRVLFDLFVESDAGREDIGVQAEGFEQDGIAQADATLYYGEKYYDLWVKDHSLTCKYLFKARHPGAQQPLESTPLEMPYVDRIKVDYIELPDVLLNHNSAVPCIDTNEMLIGVLSTTLVHAHNNPQKEVILYGHTDSSGEADYNMRLSELRCKSIKALLDNDQKTFVDVCGKNSNVEDYQTILLVLSEKYGWECNPGKVDNAAGPKTEAALKRFQEDYNLEYEQSIVADGKIGAQTWGAFHNVIRDLIWSSVANEIGGTIPKVKYGENGSGIHPCGETFAQDANTKAGRKSRSCRRVEIVFKMPDDPIDGTPYTPVVIMSPIAVTALAALKIEKIVAKCDNMVNGNRQAFWGEVLKIIPDGIGETISFDAKTSGDPGGIQWVGTGVELKTRTGATITHRFSGITSELKNWFFNLVTGIPPFVPQSPVKITAISSDSKDRKHVLVQVFPYQKKEYDLDFSDKIKSIKKLTDTFQKTCDFLGQEIKFKYLEGQVTAWGQYKEVENEKDVYFAFGVEGGFKPLIGANTEIKFPLDGVPWIPSQLKRYVAEINAVFELEGNLGATIYVERSALKKIATGGSVTGEIAVKLGLSAAAGKGKLITVSMKIVSGISGEGKVFAERAVSGENEQWAIKLECKAEWNGLEGELSWDILNGTWEKDMAITIKKPVELGKKALVFERKESE